MKQKPKRYERIRRTLQTKHQVKKTQCKRIAALEEQLTVQAQERATFQDEVAIVTSFIVGLCQMGNWDAVQTVASRFHDRATGKQNEIEDMREPLTYDLQALNQEMRKQWDKEE